MNHNNHLKVFSGRAHPLLAEEIADYLALPLGRLTLSNFPDGEVSMRIDEDVRGRDVFLVQPTCPPVNDNLMELLLMLDSFRRASAGAHHRRPAVLRLRSPGPQGRRPSTHQREARRKPADEAGANRIVALDLHAAQIQGFFDLPVDHLLAAPVFNDHIRSLNLPPQRAGHRQSRRGRIKQALKHQKQLGGGLAIVDKRRASATETQQANLIGESLRGKTAVMFDDMITTAGSMVGAVNVAALPRCPRGLRVRHARDPLRPSRGAAARRFHQADHRDQHRARAAPKATAEPQGAQRGATAG